MLSESTLENLIFPISQRQEKVNNYIIGLIANRINKIGTINASDVYKLQQMMNIGGDMQLIEKALANATNMNVRELKSILYIAAEEMYGDSKKYYEYRGMSFVPFGENTTLNSLVEAISQETAETFVNLSNTTGFVMWQGQEKVPMSIRDTYTRVVDEAVQAVKANVTDYNTAIRRSMRQLINSGVRTFGYNGNPASDYFGRTYVTYAPDSGRRYTRRLDSAVRMNVQDGVKAVNQRLQDAIGEQVGADGKEISVHRFPAPDHEPVQGHVFTNEEYEKLQNEEYSVDVDFNRFPPMRRAIGIWNCRHFTFSIIIGAYPRNYTQEQLDKIISENKKGYTYNDKHYTMYQCTQLQRQYELEIRQAKDAYLAAKELGDNALMAKYRNKVNQSTMEYKTFCESVGFSFKHKNIFVEGYS